MDVKNASSWYTCMYKPFVVSVAERTVCVPPKKHLLTGHRRKVVPPNGDWNLVIWENFQAFQAIRWGSSVALWVFWWMIWLEKLVPKEGVLRIACGDTVATSEFGSSSVWDVGNLLFLWLFSKTKVTDIFRCSSCFRLAPHQCCGALRTLLFKTNLETHLLSKALEIGGFFLNKSCLGGLSLCECPVP